MDSPRTSSLRFLDLSDNQVPAPLEWMPALVELLTPLENWQQVQLRLQGQEMQTYLKSIGGHTRILANWPRSGPGHYSLRLTVGTDTTEHTVTIAPQKISMEAYSALVEDLETRLPVSVALSLQRTGALTGIKLLPPRETTMAQELIRLRRAVVGTVGHPGLAKTLAELARDPHRVLRAVEMWVPRERARRPHPAHLPQIVVRPNNLDEDQRPLHVPDVRVEHTVDVYENRVVKAYCCQVLLRLRRLVHTLGSSGRIDLLDEATNVLHMLQQAQRQANFLQEVSLPAHLPTHLTMVLLKRPPYRAALEGYLELHRSAAVQLEEPALEAPLENLPYLYQLWGTLEVICVLLEVAQEFGYCARQFRLIRRDDSGVYVRVLPDGQPAFILVHPVRNTVIRLIPQRTYGKRSDMLHSISYEQRPDVAVEVCEPNQPVRIYLFDPKYKLDSETPEESFISSKPLKVDIDKMHAYRDAIRDEEDRRVVQYAAILYPGPLVSYAHGIAALSAVPTLEPRLADELREVFTAALQELAAVVL